MATVVKDFKVKAGLVVEGATATVNGKNILREDDSDQYIIDLIGGETLVTSVEATQMEVIAGELNIKSGVFDAYGAAAQALTDAEAYADALTTSDIAEGTNQYFTNQRALDATAAAYDAAGAAGDVAADLTTHENDTTAHGATGAVVGTTNTQTLTNKTIGDTLNFTGAGAMTINSDSHIVLTPAGGSSVKWGSDILATQGYADQAETDAKAYTDTREGLITTAYEAYTDLLLGDATIDGTGGNTVTDRIATAISDLVDSAPGTLDTLNELAAALGDNVDGATGLATAIGNKLPLAGGTMTGAIAMGTNKITGLGTPTANADAATKSYVDGEISTLDTAAQGYADAVADDLEDHELLTSVVHGVTGSVVGTTDTQDLSNKRFIDTTYFTDGATVANEGEIAVLAGSHEFEIQANSGDLGLKSVADHVILTPGSGKSVKWGADVLATQNYVDNQTTSDVAEGTNLYYTDARAKAEAAALLTSATKTNITITADGSNNLTITAENGVADSDTDDLDEGTTNLYFTDVRAVDALEAVVPNFTAVEVNSLAKQIAATVSAPTGGSQVTAYAFAKATYRSAKFLVKTAYGTHTELSEVLITLDTSDNIAITEYAIVGTNGSSSTITADVSGADVRLRVTPTNNTSTITVVGTLLA